MMNPIIEVTHLSKQFADVLAVDDISFTVNTGDVYGFLGQNGAGKSTTIRMLLTLVKPTNGQIKIFSKDLLHNRKEILRQTGAIIERPDLYKYLSAYDNLSIFAKLSGVKINRKLIMDHLGSVGLADRSNSKIKTFSQGMKQRLGIAVALVHDPKLIILDEPSNGLDPQGIADMRNLILQLKEKGKTVLISSHLLNEIELIANRMIIIHKGKKIVEGNVAELLDPADTVIKIETTDDITARKKIAGSSFMNHLQPDQNGIRFKMNKHHMPALIQFLSEEGLGILSIQPRHSLEDYFISLTNTEIHVDPAKN